MVTAILSAIALVKFTFENRAIRLTQCCTQFRSLGFKVLLVFYLHYNVAHTFFFSFLFFPKGFELGTLLSLPHLSMVESIALNKTKQKTMRCVSELLILIILSLFYSFLCYAILCTWNGLQLVCK